MMGQVCGALFIASYLLLLVGAIGGMATDLKNQESTSNKEDKDD